MKISINEVKYIAKLAKLNFKDEELSKLTDEFENILEEFQSLNSLKLNESTIDIDYNTYKNSIRSDECHTDTCQGLMNNVKSFKDGYIEVPKIID